MRFAMSANSWARLLSQEQSGAVLAQVLKENAFRSAKWLAEAVIAGTDELRVAFCHRRRVNDPNVHELLHVEKILTTTLQSQLKLSTAKLWATLGLYIK
ncbi:eukaryotic translation initiation factor 3 subunit D, partial [Kipferlia bialata]|eukprot:g16276.t1